MLRGCLFAACAMLGLVSSAPEVPVRGALDQRLALVGEALDQHLAAQDKSVQSLNAGWYFSGAVRILDGNYAMYGTEMTTESGCGGDDTKCKCNLEDDGRTLKMQGQGTSGTWTGLVFACSFQVLKTSNADVHCQVKVSIPFSGSNKFECGCNNAAFKIEGGVCTDPPSDGHHFEDYAMTLSTPPSQALALNHRRLATLNDNVRSLAADFHYDAMITFEGAEGITFVSAAKNDMDSGCGNDDSKCSCDIQSGGRAVSMKGQGTSGTWTGLIFKCSIQTSTNVDCHVKVSIPFAGGNDMNCGCNHPDYTVEGCTIGDGHDFTYKALTIKQTLPPPPIEPFSDIDFSWNYIGVNSGVEITQTRSETESTAESFSKALSEGIKTSVGGKTGVPFVAEGEVKIELSLQATQTYGETMTQTSMQSVAIKCSNKCGNDETTWQWKLRAKDKGMPVWVTRCEFACIPMSQNLVPKCPARACADRYCQCCNRAFWKEDQDSPELRKLLNEFAGGNCSFNPDGQPFLPFPF